jgi:hypothetical protein
MESIVVIQIETHRDIDGVTAIHGEFPHAPPGVPTRNGLASIPAASGRVTNWG